MKCREEAKCASQCTRRDGDGDGNNDDVDDENDDGGGDEEDDEPADGKSAGHTRDGIRRVRLRRKEMEACLPVKTALVSQLDCTRGAAHLVILGKTRPSRHTGHRHGCSQIDSEFFF